MIRTVLTVINVKENVRNVDDVEHCLLTITVYTVSQKKQDTKLLPITLHQILTNFQNSFTDRLGRKFVTYLNTPLHPKRVATLPCEIYVFK